MANANRPLQSFELQLSFDLTSDPQPVAFGATLLQLALPLLADLIAKFKKAHYAGSTLEVEPIYEGRTPPEFIAGFDLEVIINDITQPDIEKFAADLTFQLGQKIRENSVMLHDATARILLPFAYLYSEDPLAKFATVN